MKVKVSTIVLALALMTMPFALAFAPLPVKQASASPGDVLDVILTISLGFASLIGVKKLVPVVVQVLKIIGVSRDGVADRWAAGLNLLAFIALVGVGVFRPDLAASVLDGYAGKLAEILLFALGLITQITGSKSEYTDLKASGVPILNYSHTDG